MTTDNVSSHPVPLEAVPVLQAPIERHVLVCTHTHCAERGSAEVLEKLYEETAKASVLFGKRGRMDGSVRVSNCGCTGLCKVGPAVMVYPEGTWYYGVQPEDIPAMVDEHLLNNQPVASKVARTLPQNNTSSSGSQQSA